MTVFAAMLATERLQLRPPSEGDLDTITALFTDPDVRRYLGGPVPKPRAQAIARAYLSAPPGASAWCVHRTGTKLAVGMVFITRHADSDHADGDKELSFLFSPGVWGQGLATEALARVIEHALHDLKLPALLAETQAANLPARRLLERLGMTEIRRLHRHGALQLLYRI